MIIVSKSERPNLYPLFKDVPMWKAAITSAIEEGYGEIRTNSLSNPSMAVLFYGGLVIYAGNASNHNARDLVKEYPVQPAILAYSEDWNKVLLKVYGEKLKSTVRYHLPFENLSYNRISEINKYDLCKNVKAIGYADFNYLQDKLSWEHQFHHYKNQEEFVDRSYGFLYKEEGQILAGASAFIRSSKYMECQVNTLEAHRRRGLATLVSAAFISKCIENDKNISWDAANRVSVNLAKRLGYEQVEQYEILELFP